jgi:hypothetical protein
VQLKTVIYTILFIASSSFTYAQEHTTVLTSPEDWKSEIIPFPMGFAREINLVGFEDLRFAPKWSDTTSNQFFSYMFVWYVEADSAFTESRLTNYFNCYYDGLMNIDFDNERDMLGTNQKDETLCLFVKTEEGFSGKMRVFDRFFSKDYLVLNIKVSEQLCKKSGKKVIRCEISPQAFESELWEIFKDVKLLEKCQ